MALRLVSPPRRRRGPAPAAVRSAAASATSAGVLINSATRSVIRLSVLDIAVEVETRCPALRPEVPGNGRSAVGIDEDTVAVHSSPSTWRLLRRSRSRGQFGPAPRVVTCSAGVYDTDDMPRGAARCMTVATSSDNLCQLYFRFPPYCRRLGVQVYDIGVTPAVMRTVTSVTWRVMMGCARSGPRGLRLRRPGCC